MITLSSHVPFVIPTTKTKIKLRETYFSTFTNYVTAINYFDYSLGLLIDSLKQNNLFDNTILIITGDHEGLEKNDRSEIATDKRLQSLVEKEALVPLLIINSATHGTYDEVIGQLDIYPTLIDVLGIKTNWNGLGTDYFHNYKMHCVCNSNYHLCGDTLNNTGREKEAWEISNLIITKNFFKLNSGIMHSP
jgi:phosphoglycerol transferase MdoB-like AlkP superfamily enzyme